MIVFPGYCSGLPGRGVAKTLPPFENRKERVLPIASGRFSSGYNMSAPPPHPRPPFSKFILWVMQAMLVANVRGFWVLLTCFGRTLKNTYTHTCTCTCTSCIWLLTDDVGTHAKGVSILLRDLVWDFCLTMCRLGRNK